MISYLFLIILCIKKIKSFVYLIKKQRSNYNLYQWADNMNFVMLLLVSVMLFYDCYVIPTLELQTVRGIEAISHFHFL